MSKVYITGHRNPDLDSLCAASAYARLKNLTNPENEYIAVHCSPVSDSVRRQMEAMELEIPVYMKDVRPKVRDVMLTKGKDFQKDQPIFDLVNSFNLDEPPVIPVFEGKEFAGLLSTEDITAWFLKDNKETTPVYTTTIKNMLSVMPARLIHRGKSEVIEGSILVGAATAEAFESFIDDMQKCIVVLGCRKDIIELAMQKQVPAIVIAASSEEPDIDCSGYDGSVFLTELGTAETVRRIRMAEPIASIMTHPTETVEADALFSDTRIQLRKSRARGLAVMDNGQFVGVVSRRCFMEVPAYNVIMVDHNEPAQSIEGIETANVVEIIDHHRLDAVSTKTPIFIDAEPLGSTCTIVYQQYIRHGIMPDQEAARILLTGIIADTLILRSPTTTAFDMGTVEMLARITKVPSVEAFGEKLFSITDNLALQDAEESIRSDFKKYESGGVKMGIGQCEVTTLGNVGDYAERYINSLQDIADREGLDWTLLMVTDVLREKSVLLVSDYRANRDLPYAQMDKQMYSMPGVMSRKKQLLPTLISVTAR